MSYSIFSHFFILTYIGKSGKSLVWDFTCPDTVAQSNQSLTVYESGAAAAKAEKAKNLKYTELSTQYTARHRLGNNLFISLFTNT